MIVCGKSYDKWKISRKSVDGDQCLLLLLFRVLFTGCEQFKEGQLPVFLAKQRI